MLLFIKRDHPSAWVVLLVDWRGAGGCKKNPPPRLLLHHVSVNAEVAAVTCRMPSCSCSCRPAPATVGKQRNTRQQARNNNTSV